MSEQLITAAPHVLQVIEGGKGRTVRATVDTEQQELDPVASKMSAVLMLLSSMELTRNFAADEMKKIFAAIDKGLALSIEAQAILDRHPELLKLAGRKLVRKRRRSTRPQDAAAV